MEYPFLGKEDSSVIKPVPISGAENCSICKSELEVALKCWSEKDSFEAGERCNSKLCEVCASEEFGEERVSLIKQRSSYM